MHALRAFKHCADHHSAVHFSGEIGIDPEAALLSIAEVMVLYLQKAAATNLKNFSA
jgi:hypothetical protein